MPEYPEHEKLAEVRDYSQRIYDFLEWASEQGWRLAEWDRSRQVDDRMMPISLHTKDVLARYFEIDLDVLEAEKRQMIEQMRAAHG